MSFVSYAQNAEDVMLWRALKHVQNGFYIDVGANDPVEDSVTLALYERGWRGINIEPVPRHFADLTIQRAGDINLPVAVGAEPGTFTLYEIENVRGWGTLDPDMAGQYRQQGYPVIEIPVTVTTLADICSQYVTGEIHFLKVDVEGVEEQVFRGMDFKRWRPWVIIAESRVPTENGPVTAAWESLLLAQGYTAVYFDGINTFYLAEEYRLELQEAFDSPPNVLDDFVRHSEWQSGRYAEALEAKISELQHYAGNLGIALENAGHQLADREHQLATLYASTSWRVTAPLRLARRLLKLNSAVKALARLGQKCFSGLKGDCQSGAETPAVQDITPPDLERERLSADAREIYETLNRRDSL